MSASLLLLFSKSYWRYGFSTRRFLRSIFFAGGVLWTSVESFSYYFQDIADKWIKPHWWWFIVLAVLWGMWENRPSRKIEYRLRQRDVTIAIEVGNIFWTKDALVVGSNTTFDTDLTNRIISPASVQGQFTNLYYSDTRHLDADINHSLNGLQWEEVPNKTFGKNRRYPLGTVARISPKDRTAYLVAIAELNNAAVAHGTLEGLRQSLSSLWQYIAENGELGRIRIPVLGTGLSRLTETRAEIIEDIVRSFIAACAERRFCEHLTIVVPPKDFGEHEIDIVKLEDFLRLTCEFAEFRRPNDPGEGTATG
jgi:hypothetical protein